MGFRSCFYAVGCWLSIGCVAAQSVAVVEPDRVRDRELAALLSKLTDRNPVGLRERALPRGGVAVDLDGRFQNVSLAQFDAQQTMQVACVASLAEANGFLGRDLLSGQRLPKSTLWRNEESSADRAHRHGMGAEAYRHSSALIHDYAADTKLGSAIVIVNADGAGEGFNSTAPPLLPAPGNPGTSLGAQRLAVFNAAANIWAAFLDSPVDIRVSAAFNSLSPCSGGGGVVGSAGTAEIFRDDPDFEYSGTFYHAALANKQAGVDLSRDTVDINATFNSDVDTGCLGSGTRFYYGLDNAAPPGTVNLLVVLLHELGHGLGSSSFVAENGSYAGSAPDIWARFMYDRSRSQHWFAMSNAQRASSLTNQGNVLWDGANLRQASSFLSAGRETTTGRVEMFVPGTYQQGSSVSHFSSSASPNLLMEPVISAGVSLSLDLTRQQMRDIGWFRDTTQDGLPDGISEVQPSGGHVAIGTEQTIRWSNQGGFDRAVSIDLSLDGGASYSSVASAISNSGEHPWTVPNTQTSQALLRVREHDFLTPLGQSAAAFSIGPANTAPSFTAAAVSLQQGSPAAAAITIGSVSDAQTFSADLLVTAITGGSASGITVGAISNTNGSVRAVLSAGCAASSGTLRFQVSDGSLSSTADVAVSVIGNAPPTLSYANASVTAGNPLLFAPSSGPADNGSISSLVVHDTGGFIGSLSVDALGIVTLANANPPGTHRITLRATDNCGAINDAQFDLQVAAPNTAPSFTAATAIEVRQGSAGGAAIAIGSVSDAESAPGQLTATALAGGTAIGVQIDSLSNEAGTLNARLRSTCDAQSGTLRIEVSDGEASVTGDLTVDVLANTPPQSAVYAALQVEVWEDQRLFPLSPPSDNGTVVAARVQIAPTSFTGTAEVGAADGAIDFTAPGPEGSYSLTIELEDACGATSNQTLPLQVARLRVFRNGFEGG